MKRTGSCLASLCLLFGVISHTGFSAAAFAAGSPAGNDDHKSSSQISSPYAQWKNGPSSDPNYFPLAVWMQSPAHIREFQDIGINTFIGYWGKLNQADLDLFARSGMSLVLGQNTFAISAPNSSAITAWLQPDEPDNAQPLAGGGHGPCIPPKVLQDNYAQNRKNDPSRPVLLGFGRGVSNIRWRGRGNCTGDTNYYEQAASAGDILSFDIYPVANGTGHLEDPARGVKNLIRWSGGRKIIWNDIEAARIHGGAVPTASQLRSEIWMSIIAGSRGISYFVDQLSPTFREDGIFNHPELVRGVKAINQEILSLAPVLNSATIEGKISVSSLPSTVPIGVMMKKSGGTVYVFAAAMADTPAEVDFELSSIDQGVVDVLGEHRNIPLSRGIFHDRFAGYSVHLYRIAANSHG